MYSDTLVANVKAAEGLRLIAYKDTLGNWTVGYGHKLSPDRDWLNYSISQDYASTLLTLDLNQAYKECLSLPEWPKLDTQARQDAVTECVFNMGRGTWVKFTQTRLAISVQNWQEAHDELLHSLWANQVKGRADRIASQLLQGSYPNGNN